MSAAAQNPAKFLPSVAYRKAGLVVVSKELINAEPQTAGNYGVFFVAPYKCAIVAVDAVWATAGSTSTVTVEKLTGTTAPGGGTAVLSSTISTAATANTVTAGTLSTTDATTELAAGDRLALVSGGNLTSLADLCVTVTLCPIP